MWCSAIQSIMWGRCGGGASRAPTILLVARCTVGRELERAPVQLFAWGRGQRRRGRGRGHLLPVELGYPLLVLVTLTGSLVEGGGG